ncbi:N-acetylmuramoyl-L-alanine amidase CwlM [Lachnospiraceae bacterium]|nr:N-acetylmuramoyl-L-alanine amidase CwlM [Lachnospiraceae bacterium]
MKFDLMKKAAVFSVLFSTVAMGTIIYLSAGKGAGQGEGGHIFRQNTPTAGEQRQGRDSGQPTPEPEVKEGDITFVLGDSNTSYLCIPLPAACQAEDIAIENHYMERELNVLINSGEKKFYLENGVSGNREGINWGRFEIDGNRVRLRFQLKGIFEYHTILEGNTLYVGFVSPRELYDKIVVIDPACGGMNGGNTAGGLEEKEINLKIAEKLKEKLDKTDIKAYYTRMDDVNPEEDARAALANETRADMYICIQTDASEDISLYGTSASYNGDFFIPGFGSRELAELLAQEVVGATRGKLAEVYQAEAEEYTLRQITIPAAAVKVGCLSNKQEAILLQREEYQEKIADGIYNAIVKAYGSLG